MQVENIGGRTQYSRGSSEVSYEIGFITLTEMCAFSYLIGHCNTDISLPEAAEGEPENLSEVLRSFLS